jgi:MOSC domain-containing protein YiiM
MVTRPLSDKIPADRAILRHIVRDLDQNVGVYATVVSPGAIEEGDTVTLLD